MVSNRREHARRHHLGLRFDSQLDAPLDAARVLDVVSGAVPLSSIATISYGADGSGASAAPPEP
jgi:hypothetical protein